MRKILLKFVVLSLLIASALLIPVFSGSTHAQSAAGKPVIACYTTQIHLNGSRPMSQKCVQSTASKSGIGPDAGENNGCPGYALWVYAGQNFGGARLCIDGSGLLNMTVPCYLYQPQSNTCIETWNDLAGSYFNGCSPTTFYSDINRGGYAFTASAYGNGNFPHAGITWGGHYGLSSVWLDTSCT